MAKDINDANAAFVASRGFNPNPPAVTDVAPAAHTPARRTLPDPDSLVLSKEKLKERKFVLALKGNPKAAYFEPPYLRAIFPRLTFEGNITPDSKSEYPPATRDKAELEVTVTQGGYDAEDVARALPHLHTEQVEHRGWKARAAVRALRLVFRENPKEFEATLAKCYTDARKTECVRFEGRGEKVTVAQLIAREANDAELRERVRAAAEDNFVEGLKYPIRPTTDFDEHGRDPSGELKKAWKQQFSRSAWRVKKYVKDKKYAPTHWAGERGVPSTLRSWPRVLSEMIALGFYYNPFKFIDASTGAAVVHPNIAVPWLDPETNYTTRVNVLADPLSGEPIPDLSTADVERISKGQEPRWQTLPLRAPKPGAPLPFMPPRELGGERWQPIVVPGSLVCPHPGFEPIKPKDFTLLSLAYTIEVIVLGKDESGGYGVRFTPGDTLRVGVTRAYTPRDAMRADFPAGLKSTLSAVCEQTSAGRLLTLEDALAAEAAQQQCAPPTLLALPAPGDSEAAENAAMAAAAEAAENAAGKRRRSDDEASSEEEMTKKPKTSAATRLGEVD